MVVHQCESKLFTSAFSTFLLPSFLMLPASPVFILQRTLSHLSPVCLPLACSFLLQSLLCSLLLIQLPLSLSFEVSSASSHCLSVITRLTAHHQIDCAPGWLLQNSLLAQHATVFSIAMDHKESKQQIGKSRYRPVTGILFPQLILSAGRLQSQNVRDVVFLYVLKTGFLVFVIRSIWSTFLIL